MLKCNTCGGTYSPTNPDGSRYFHACPPLSRVELADALATNPGILTFAQRAAFDQAKRDDQARPLDASQPTRVADLLSTLVVERPNGRDENVTGLLDDNKRPIIKAAGNGVTKLS